MCHHTEREMADELREWLVDENHDEDDAEMDREPEPVLADD